MSKVLLITNPADDRATEYLDSWLEDIIEVAKKQPTTVVHELRGGDANKQKLTDLIEEHKPSLVILNGHGLDDRITGFNGEVLIKCDENEELLKNTIIHTMSCSSGKKLGPNCIKIGTVSYLGYSENYELVHLDKTTKDDQKKDHVAKLFLQPAFEVITALIEGATTEEAYNRSQKMNANNLLMAYASTSTDYNTAIASRLHRNLNSQVCLGDPNATLE